MNLENDGADLVLRNLTVRNISYQIVEHPPVFTTEEANRYIEGWEGVRTKSLFLTNRKKTAYYLIIMDDSKRLDMAKFEETIKEKRIKMASPANLKEKLGLEPGSVSIFGLLNNTTKDVQVYFDQDIMPEKIMSFHPNDNTKTIFVKTTDILNFIEAIGYDYHTIAL